MSRMPGRRPNDRDLDEALEMTFPASDPIAIGAARDVRAVPADDGSRALGIGSKRGHAEPAAD